MPAEGDAAHSFPMDKSHGFGVVHDKVWDGSMEDASTGLCGEGTPDADGRCIRFCMTAGSIVDFVFALIFPRVFPTYISPVFLSTSVFFRCVESRVVYE